LESEKDGVPTYRITDWEPYEVSIVSMPADINCGIGRAADAVAKIPETKIEETRTMKKCKHCGREIDQDFCGCPGERKAIQEEARLAEVGRCKAIRDAARSFSERGGSELAEELVNDPSATVDTFRERMLAKIDAEQKQTENLRREGHTESRVTETLRYDRKSLDAFSRYGAKAEEVAHKSGQWARAILTNDEKAVRWCKDHGLDMRVMYEGSGAAGGFLVPDEMENSIIDLRLKYGVCRQVAQRFPMNSGTLSIPKWSSGTTAYFPGEQSATTESDAAFQQVQLVAKELSALTRVSMSLMEDSVIDLASFLAEQQAYAFAVKEDACWIDGDGTSTYGGMVGLKALLETSGMAGIFTAAAATDLPSEIILSELNGVMSVCPSYALNGAGWLLSPTYKALVIEKLAAAAGGNTNMTLANGVMTQQFLGYPINTAENCYKTTATDLSGKAFLFFGNFRQGTAFGERRGITIQVLRERYAEYRQVGVLGSERIDIVNHGCGDTSNAGPIVALIGGAS
jgi:HK97 family phage major capsid protein